MAKDGGCASDLTRAALRPAFRYVPLPFRRSLGGRDNQDGRMRVTHHMFRRAADERVGQGGLSMGSGNDQINVGVFRKAADFVRRLAALDFHLIFHAQEIHLLQKLARSQAGRALDNAGRRHSFMGDMAVCWNEGLDLNRVEQDKAGFETPGKGNGVEQSFPRAVGEIEGHENLVMCNAICAHSLLCRRRNSRVPFPEPRERTGRCRTTRSAVLPSINRRRPMRTVRGNDDQFRADLTRNLANLT